MILEGTSCSSPFLFTQSIEDLEFVDKNLNTMYATAHLSTILPLHDKQQEVLQKISDIRKKSGIYHCNFIVDFFDRTVDAMKATFFCSSEAIQKQQLRTMITKVEASVKRVEGFLTKHRDSVSAQKKWLDWKLPARMIQEHPELIQKLYYTGDFFSMVGYTREGKNAPLFKEENGTVVVLYKGRYIPCADFDKKIQVDKSVKQLFIQLDDGRKEYINAVASSQGGFIALDQNAPMKMDKPVDKVSVEEFEDIVHHANQYDRGVNQPKKTVAVIQICTRLGNTVGRLPKVANDLIDDNETNVPSHYFCRLIDSNRDVHSFGKAIRLPFCDTDQDLMTKPGSIKNNDYCEFREGAGDLIVTSIPLSQEDVDMIKAKASEPHCIFQYMQSSCTSFVSEILTDLKIDVPIENSIEQLLFRAFSRPIMKATGLGPLFSQINKVMKVSQQFFKNIIPKRVQNIVSNIGNVVSLPFQHSFAFIKSLGVQYFGGDRISEGFSEAEKRGRMRPLISSWEDRWNLRATNVHDSVKLLDWQLRQTTSERFMKKRSGKPLFHILKKFEAVG